jgi:hypothetical protein
MVDTSDVLRYVGTILIGFQLVSKMGYVQTFINLSLARPIRGLVTVLPDILRGDRLSPKVGMLTLLFVLVVLLTIGTITLSPFLLVELLVGRPLVFLNSMLNWLLLKLIEPWKDSYFTAVRGSVRGHRLKHKPTDRRLWDIAKKNDVPFIGLSGILCVTASFIIEMVS